MPNLAKEMRVRILIPLLHGIAQEGVVTGHASFSREMPWHVKPDNWPKNLAAIAFAASELEPLEENEQGGSHAVSA